MIALEIVAKTPAHLLSAVVRDELRAALLDEQWGKAVELWLTDFARQRLDVYPSGLRIWTDAMITADMTSLELQFRPLFRDD